eukprot:CAMPEP_0168824208 /NCGR_PEP_ID=MMETSP0726-20121227/10964_1 /TAXON_ID=265536 /ORGANISM="Amphiprora sp., Strain CCMP467" /LENGTH=300 /DNA_ID=CAMNT_0008877179 /DNA_START=25 /DNA_END=928 /DNA_ORIENTATION=+
MASLVSPTSRKANHWRIFLAAIIAAATRTTQAFFCQGNGRHGLSLTDTNVFGAAAILSVANSRRSTPKADVQKMDSTIVTPRFSNNNIPNAVENDGNDPDEHEVPRRLGEALRVFFLGAYHGPRLIVAILFGVALQRWDDMAPLTVWDGAVAAATVVFWWFQEFFVHRKLLHSAWDWYGKRIHAEHHQNSYLHISIDPAGLMLGWLVVAHVMLRLMLPLPLALSATFAYAAAGLWYEYLHFIVHTRVRFRPNSYWEKMKSHHSRHHLVNENYWLGFSLPVIDTWMGTNPHHPKSNEGNVE